MTDPGFNFEEEMWALPEDPVMPAARTDDVESEISRLLEKAREYLQLYPNNTGLEPNARYVRELISQAPSGYTEALLEPSLTKRQKWALGIILRDTFVTTLSLQPANGHLDSRAIRELPERGIPLKEMQGNGTFQASTLNPLAFKGAETGRSGISFKVKLAVIQRASNTCERCGRVFSQPRNFNPDHRRPHALDKSDSYFEKHGIDALQNLCVPCNQKKLTACRECPNRDPEKCYTPGDLICHWADAKNGNHIALEPLNDVNRKGLPSMKPRPQCCEAAKRGPVWWEAEAQPRPAGAELVNAGWVAVKDVSIPGRMYWLYNPAFCPLCGQNLPEKP
jgi:hypothetical protein